MQTTQTRIGSKISQTNTHNPKSKENIEAAAELMNKTMVSLLASFPAWRTSANGNPDEYLKTYRANLLRAMIESGILSDSMISKGLRAARASKKPFLPALGEFCAWCMPDYADYGLPCSDDAYTAASRESGKAAVNRRFPHAAVYLAAKNIGFRELAQRPEREIKASFVRAYDEICKAVISGVSIEAPPELRIDKPTIEKAPKHVTENHLERLYSLFD